jgi:hypothetical protein
VILQKPSPEIHGTSFVAAYWDYLRRITPEEPNAADYGLDEQSAEALRRQCTIEHTNQVRDEAQAEARIQKRLEEKL